MRCPNCDVINPPGAKQCPACGYNFATQQIEPVGRFAEDQQSELAFMPGFRWALSAYRLLKWLGAGLFSMAMGVWLILDPNLTGRAGNWVGVSAGDFLPGLGALVVGIVLLVVFPVLARRNRQETRPPRMR